MTPPRKQDGASLAALRSAVLEHISAFLAGKETAFGLDEWLTDATWNVHFDADPMMRQLAGKTALYLTEYAKGHRTDEELRDLLRDVLMSHQGRAKVV